MNEERETEAAEQDPAGEGVADRGPVVLTLAVCTWNRAARLRRLLESIATATPPPVPWEVLVVDNNSADETRAVASALGARLPLRYVFEPVQGLSAARNRALAEARSDLLVFTDDDVTLGPGFLPAYATAAARESGAAFFGGGIQVRFEAPEPGWVHVNPIVSMLAFGQIRAEHDAAAIVPPKLPYGANFALRRSLLAGARFDPTLGLRGTERLQGEETDLVQRLIAAGHAGRWVEGALVHHWIPPEQATWRHVLRYFVGTGRTRVREPRFATGEVTAARAARAMVSHLLRASVRRAMGHHSWTAHLCFAAAALGELHERVRART